MRAVFAVFCLVMVATQGNQEVMSQDDLALSEDARAPTNTPTNAPTRAPSNAPTNQPTNAPTRTPTRTPTNAPTHAPTNTPTNAPRVKGPFGDLQTQDAALKTMWADDALDKTAGGRVNAESFKQFMKVKYGAKTDETAAYDQFLGTVFTAATSMMLPDVKTDLGEHCFTYAAAFAGEFYFADNSAPDRLKLKGKGAVTDLDTSWTNIPKDNSRVAKANFVAFFAGKYSHGKYMRRTTATKTAAFRTFADKVFIAATSMMLPKSKTDLGEHCFKYAAGLMGEFYF